MPPNDVFPALEEPLIPSDPRAVSPAQALQILVVEDHPANRMVMQVILTPMGSVVFAENGQQAVEAARRQPFDVIFMDLNMPVMDGIAATRQIRKDEQAAGRVPTPLFMLTANDLEEYVDLGRDAGADGYLVKPVSAAVLQEVVREAVRR